MLEVTSSETAQIVSAIATPIGVMFAAWIGYMTMRSAKKAEEVRTTLAVVSKVTDAKLDQIHMLVNSNMEAALQINMLATRRIANGPDAKDEDFIAAKLAADAYLDHRLRQTVVDTSIKTAKTG